MLGKLIGEGYFSEVYEYGADKAIKLMRSCFSKEYVQSEYERLQEVHEKFQWSPAVYGIKEIDGRHGIIFDRAKGRPISDYVMRYVWNLKKYLMILLKYQLILHSIRTDKLPSYMDILKKNINRIPELFDAQKEFILDYAARLPHQSYMCHGDFHTDNVIMRKKEIMVIDWSTAYSGNPQSDVINIKILMKLPVVTKKMKFPVNVVCGFFKILIRRIYLKAYIKKTGATMKELDRWLLPSAVIRLGEGVPNGREVLLNIINSECKRLGFDPESIKRERYAYETV